MWTENLTNASTRNAVQDALDFQMQEHELYVMPVAWQLQLQEDRSIYRMLQIG